MKLTNNVEDERVETVEEDTAVDSLFLRMIGQGDTGVASGARTGVVVGRLFGYTGQDRAPLVQFSGPAGSAPALARSAVALGEAHIGKQVVLVFEDADAAKPIIIGVLRNGEPASSDAVLRAVEVHVDGERVVIDAPNQLVLRCGRASITLTKAGKVLIQGEYVSSRSVGVHRIKGGSVQIN